MTLEDWLQESLSKFVSLIESAIYILVEFFYYFFGFAPFWKAPVAMGICVAIAYIYTAGLLIMAGERALGLLNYCFDYVFDGDFRRNEKEKRREARLLQKEERLQEEQRAKVLDNTRINELLTSERFSKRLAGRFEKSPIFAMLFSLAALSILTFALLILAWAGS